MLTSKQRAYLRKLANKLEPVLYIGKDGISDNTVIDADKVLTARELIKGAVQQNAPLTSGEASGELAARVNADVVSVVGSKFVLYRPSEEKKIKL